MKYIILVATVLISIGCSEQAAQGDESLIEVKSDVEVSAIKTDEPVSSTDTGLRSDEVSNPPAAIDENTEYKDIAWTDLMPQEDIDALMNPPSYVINAKEGSIEDQIGTGLKSAMASQIEDPYQRALASKNVVAAYDGMAIKLAGFVVPLEFSDEQVITEFFLVPFFGACIHVPPPPPNQIIYVNYAKGFKLDALYNPIWVYGVLSASLTENDMATSVYSLEMARQEPYREQQ